VKTLFIILLSITPSLFHSQNNGIGINTILSTEKIKAGLTLERENLNRFRFEIAFNYGYSKQNYPVKQDSKPGPMFELPYMDDQEHLYAGYENSSSKIQAFSTEVQYTQLIGGKLPNSTSGFGIYKTRLWLCLGPIRCFI